MSEAKLYTDQMERERDLVRTWLGASSINIFGLPFAGKDVQSAKLAGWLGAPIIGGGQILRTMLASGQLSEEVRTALNRGDLIPREDFLKVITPYLGQPEYEGRPLVLNSVGRYFGEEGPIMEATAASGHPMKVVVCLMITEAIAIDRYEASKVLGDRGDRAEDHEESVPHRFREFARKTQPVIDFYHREKLLIRVDGDGSVDEVAEQIHHALYRAAQGVMS